MTGGKNRTPRVTLAGESPVASRRKTRESIRTTVSAERPPRERVSLLLPKRRRNRPRPPWPWKSRNRGDASCSLPGCLQPEATGLLHRVPLAAREAMAQAGGGRGEWGLLSGAVRAGMGTPLGSRGCSCFHLKRLFSKVFRLLAEAWILKAEPEKKSI